MDLFSDPPSTTAAATQAKDPTTERGIGQFQFSFWCGPESGGGPPDRIYGRYLKTGGERGGDRKEEIGVLLPPFSVAPKKSAKVQSWRKKKNSAK